MSNWKDLFTNRDRRFFPEVVVPLARDPPSVTMDTSEKSGKDPLDGSGSNSSLNHGSIQEKGVASVPATTTLTYETLQAEIESGVVASGHDTIYDRTFDLQLECF